MTKYCIHPFHGNAAIGNAVRRSQSYLENRFFAVRQNLITFACFYDTDKV
jgi:hypothetical protein